MLYSVEMRLRMTRPSASTHISGYHILSLFLRLIENGSPALAEELHRDSAVKPFTLSPLLPPPGKRLPAMLGEGGNLSLRITFLEERVFTALADAVWRLSSETELPLGDIRVLCQRLATTPAESPWANFASFNQLMENAGADAGLRFEFLTPTTFRSRGERNVLFPEPSLVFGSLLNRWNAFADPSLKLDLAEGVIGAVRVSRYRLATRLLDFGNYRELGFTGQATYECNEGMPSEYLKAFNVLADFAFYSGVGAKTTMGMGQCRRSGNARAVSH